jgi:hypothetical protein
VVPARSSGHCFSCAARILAAVRQKLHLSRCSDFQSQLYVRAELAALTEGEPHPRRKIYDLCADGALPMAQYIRGRWYFARADLPALAQALGLPLKRSSCPSSRATRPAA